MNKVWKICVICSGNICRSPFAEKVLQKKLGKQAEVFSAGTLGIFGREAYHVCQQLASNYQINLKNHLSQGLKREDLATCDYILAMTVRHLHSLPNLPSPPQAFLLSEFLPTDQEFDLGLLGKISKGQDIPDPMGSPAIIVQPVLDLIELACTEFVKSLRR